jgi:hypothetical protein
MGVLHGHHTDGSNALPIKPTVWLDWSRLRGWFHEEPMSAV